MMDNTTPIMADPDKAEAELRRKLEIDDNADVSARHLKMREG